MPQDLVVRTSGGVRTVCGVKSARLEIRLEEELLGRLPSGSRERSAFVRKALEAALGGALENAPGRVAGSTRGRVGTTEAGLRSREGEGRRSSRAVPVSPRAPALEGFKPQRYRCKLHPEFTAGSAKAQCWCNRLVVPA